MKGENGRSRILSEKAARGRGDRDRRRRKRGEEKEEGRESKRRR